VVVLVVFDVRPLLRFARTANTEFKRRCCYLWKTGVLRETRDRRMAVCPLRVYRFAPSSGGHTLARDQMETRTGRDPPNMDAFFVRDFLIIRRARDNPAANYCLDKRVARSPKWSRFRSVTSRRSVIIPRDLKKKQNRSKKFVVKSRLRRPKRRGRFY